ncbi:MAG TPA: single-stranded DNA-binding protein [Clostridia bacterium]|nr:single-stranded DNA-binding protein [Clostridia bacterium]
MNRAILIGNLTRDPEVRTTNSGVSVCTFSIAVNRKNKSQSGERPTDFFNIVAWRQLGELCGKYLAQGRKVCVVGELQNRSYEGKDGTKRYVTEIIADDVEFLTPRSQDGGSNMGSEHAPSSLPARGADFEPEGFTDVDDELPF